MPQCRLSIVIASRRGPVEPALDFLLTKQLPSQTFQDFDVHVMVGDNRQGRAINEGVGRSRGEIVATMDDDVELGDERVLRNLIDLLDGDPSVGIAGASCPIPPDASTSQRAALRQIPRRFFPVVSEPTETDMVQHGCLALRRELFLRIGGEDEELVRGLDPIIRRGVRDLGLRVVVAPKTWFYHRPPRSASGLLRMYFRNGRGSGLATRRFPDRVLELGAGTEGETFPVQRSLSYRVTRKICRIGRGLVSGEWILLSTDLAYTAGFLAEYLRISAPPLSGNREIRLDRMMGDRIHIWRSLPVGAVACDSGARP